MPRSCFFWPLNGEGKSAPPCALQIAGMDARRLTEFWMADKKKLPRELRPRGPRGEREADLVCSAAEPCSARDPRVVPTAGSEAGKAAALCSPQAWHRRRQRGAVGPLPSPSSLIQLVVWGCPAAASRAG